MGTKFGVLRVNLYRPWSEKHFLEALPKSVKKICVLDKTREEGSIGNPLYLDTLATMNRARPHVKVNYFFFIKTIRLSLEYTVSVPKISHPI